MSGYYPQNQNLPQYYNANPSGAPSPNYPNARSMMAPDGSMPPGLPESPIYGMSGSYVHYSEHQIQQAYVDQHDNISGSAQGGNSRMRRRSAPGDNVKHRRTRSGCKTCRQRRVKCDETHPICERCQKGNRDCLYPDADTRPSSKTGRSGGRADQKSGTDASSPEDLDDEEYQDRLPPIFDDGTEDVDTDIKPSTKHKALRETPDTPSLTLDHSPTPSTEASSTVTHPVQRQPLSRISSNLTAGPTVHTGISPLSGLPHDVRFYLDYFRNHMSHHHYSLKRDSGNFFQNDFFSMAIKHEPLRYAVVGYAAYFHTISRPDGRMSDFLKYYNESVSRLRSSITKNKKQGLSTFMTILQLASIEEVLGDWVNLNGHQKAAYEILTRLYTPETITQSSMLRNVLLWYTRFDLYVGFQSGGESVLSRDWYVAVYDYYAGKARESPNNLTMKYEERFAHSRLVAKDSNDLFAKKSKGVLTDEEFMERLPRLTERVGSLDKNIHPVLLDPSEYVDNLAGKADPEDIVDAYKPNTIWAGSRWTSNYLLLDMYGIIFMFHLQLSMAFRKPLNPDLMEKAYRVVQVFEAICAYPNAPPGAIIEAQTSVAIATLFLPKDKRTIEWCRRTFIKIEVSGYIYSNIMRNRMLEQWGLEPAAWWLPNDEGCPRIIRSIKNFIHERTIAPRDQTSEDLREMRGIFSTLTISDSPPDQSSETQGSQSSGGAPSIPDETHVFTGGSPDYDWNYEGNPESI